MKFLTKKSAAAARINSMESERIFLERLLIPLTNQVFSIEERLKNIDIQIRVEKESCKDIKD